MDILECAVWVLGLVTLGFVLTSLIAASVGGGKGVEDLCLKFIPNLSEVVLRRFAAIVEAVFGRLAFLAAVIFVRLFFLVVYVFGRLVFAVAILLARIENWFLTGHILYVFCLMLMVEFAHGWWFAREDMKAMAKEAVEEGKLIVAEGKLYAAEIKEAISGVFYILSDPWRLAGYTLLIYLVYLQPGGSSEMEEAAADSG
jgi:hypothetical protein